MKKTAFLVVRYVFLVYAVVMVAQSAPPTTSIDTNSINKLLRQSKQFYNEGQLEQTLLYARKARLLALKILYKKGIAESYLNEGRALFRQSKYYQAIVCLNTALVTAQQTGDSVTQSVCLNGLGINYASIGNPTKAIAYYLQGLAIEERLPVQNNLPWYYCNIGALYLEQNNSEKGREYSYKALEAEKKIPNERVRSIVNNNLGVIYSANGVNDSALLYYKRSFQISEQSKDTFSIANSSSNIASIYLRLKKYDAAEKYNSKSYKLSKAKGYEDVLVLNYINMAIIAEASKNYTPAEEYLLEGLEITKKLNSKKYSKDIYKELATLYTLKGDYKTAYAYYKNFSAVKDSILNQGNSKLITEMNTKYTTEKKEREVALLKTNERIQNLELSKRKNELIKQRTITTSIFAGFVLLLFVAILIFSRYRIKKKATDQLQEAVIQIEERNRTIEKTNLLITDSITYAKRIQDAVLPAQEELDTLFSEDHFILYKPAQIVSGDFYWCSERDNRIVFVVADCTGHGVPGAFMSLIGNTLLNEIVNERGITDPPKIAELLDKKVIHALHQHIDINQYDGMDISIYNIDKEKKEITFTGANHSFYAFTDQLQKYKGDSHGIGRSQHNKPKIFTSQIISYASDIRLYFLTDGYCDQAGGSSNKRLTSAKLRALLTEISGLSMFKQKQKLEEAFENWKGKNKQRDDVLIVGIRL